MVLLVILAGIGLGGWQIYQYLNSPTANATNRIDISQDGGYFPNVRVTINNTSSDQLTTAVQQISELNPDLLTALNDPATVLTTSDHLLYDGGYHLISITANATHTKQFQGITNVTLAVRAAKFDITNLDGNFSNLAPLKIASLTNQNIINALQTIPNLNPNLVSVLSEDQLKINDITPPTLISDGRSHLIHFTLDANQTKQFQGTLLVSAYFIATKINISNINGNYLTSPPVVVGDLTHHNLIYLIQNVEGVDPNLATAVNDPNILVSTSSSLLPNNQSSEIDITVDANATKNYMGILLVKLQAKNGIIDISNLNQDLTFQPAVSEPDTKPNELIAALKQVSGLNPTLLYLLDQSGIKVTTDSVLNHDGLAHKIDIKIIVLAIPNYTGQAVVSIMMKSTKIDITKDEDYTNQHVTIGNDLNANTLIAALNQLGPTIVNKDILAAIKDPQVIVTSDSPFQVDNKPHPIKININAQYTKQYEGTAHVKILMQSNKTDITNDGGDYSQYQNVIFLQDTSQEQLVAGLEQLKNFGIKQTLLTAIKDPHIQISSSDNPTNFTGKKITININAGNTAQFYGKTSVTIWANFNGQQRAKFNSAVETITNFNKITYVGTATGDLYQQQDQSWTKLANLKNSISKILVNNNKIYVGTLQGTIYCSDDWTKPLANYHTTNNILGNMYFDQNNILHVVIINPGFTISQVQEFLSSDWTTDIFDNNLYCSRMLYAGIINNDDVIVTNFGIYNTTKHTQTKFPTDGEMGVGFLAGNDNHWYVLMSQGSLLQYNPTNFDYHQIYNFQKTITSALLVNYQDSFLIWTNDGNLYNFKQINQPIVKVGSSISQILVNNDAIYLRCQNKIYSSQNNWKSQVESINVTTISLINGNLWVGYQEGYLFEQTY
ncbi:PQQ-binding-like beta-propeller repeat protein [Spiroplasma eriocheiris]|uniref:PQQ-binding-like beta-propeller repeat protein n=1 Tax=Spiroplasma eriocheiris TaxID=315358 RepID=UPI0009A49299|nr:PQQ-binding-like beta-propeller repeat protein [Spiroplasma eriocheiris]AHF57708.1 hypothetical protein SPE_0580 [Spiroplasma eriocheiris CCTCC M 207170]